MTDNMNGSDQYANTTDQKEVPYIHDPICDTEEMRKIFVGGITPESKEEELQQLFERVSGGQVTDKVIIRKDPSKNSVFGFVTFATSEQVDEVLLKRSELTFNNRNLDVNRAVPKSNTNSGAHEKLKKLFVANLPKTNCSEDDLREYFEARHPKKYGIIESVQLIKKKDEQGNKTTENKGFGFVMVSSEDMADKMAIQHATFEFKGRKIELKKSVPNTEGGGGGGRGRGASRGGRGGNRGGYDQSGGAGYGAGGYGAGGGYDYSGGYGGYGGGYGSYDYGSAGGYGGYGAPPARGAARGGRGRGASRYTPY